MEAFSMKIAGLVTRVQPLYETTREHCRAYLTCEEPELTVAVSPEDLLFEQMMFEREAVAEGMKIRKFTGPFLERASIQRRVADELLKRDVLLLHGSTVGVDGQAYLFTASCGTGKSTHTRLWREVFGSRAVMVNDDKTFLSISNSGVLAYGSPWSGKHGLHSNVCLPLKGICLLNRGLENEIYSLRPQDAKELLLHQSLQPEDSAGLDHVSLLVDRLMELVPLWKLVCNKNPSAAEVSFSAMSSVL